jgi:ubiquinone/menaquinone biosynthesis C-methylase UbiE
MGIYNHQIVPRLLDFAMRNARLHPYRRRVIGSASGLVLEIGVGSGGNLPLYGSQVDRVFALDPSAELLRMAAKRTAQAAVPILLVRAAGERLPFRGAVFDTVVTTWTLCSIPHPAAALSEMRRVLKPTGKLVFVEHGLSPEWRVARWQHRLTPVWRRISGGCHLDRKMDDLIRAAGFRLDAIDTGYMAGPKVGAFLYEGRAGR